MPAFYTIQKRTSHFAPEKKTRYYPIAKSWDKISYEELVEYMVRNTSLSKQEAFSALGYLQEAIPKLLKLGHTIDLGKLGHMQLAIRSEGSDTPEEATWHKIRDIRVCFVPSKQLRDEVRSLPVEQFPTEEPSHGTGYNRAMRKARRETEEKTNRQTVLRCLGEGLTIEQTARISGLSAEKVEQIAKPTDIESDY